MNDIQIFWEANDKKSAPTQLERYEAAGAPPEILKFIRMGGGPKMGSTCERFARHRFACLQKRSKGKDQTGYDHRIVGAKTVLVEQKSSGHWGADDFRWQHIEPDHKWEILLLCGIGIKDIHFWTMDRKTYAELRAAGKITNQGNKAGESSEGTWFNYSAVKDHLKEVKTAADLATFAAKN